MARKIVIEFLGDSKDLQKAVGDAESKSGKLSGTLKKVGAAAAIGFGALGAAAVVGGKYVLDHGAKLEQMAMKADTVFGSQIGKVNKWADANANAMGLSSREATGLAANFGDLLIPMGFTRKQAAGMSTDVVGLSGALSQWSGGTVSAAEASDVLAKAMLGERDGLKSLGISISEADVQARLAKNGTDSLTGAALEQAKAVATQQLIMEKSTDAQAAFAAGGSPLLSAQAKVKGILAEVRDEMVMKLVPAVGMAADWFLNKGLPAMQAFGGWLGDVLPPIFDRIKAVVSTVMGAMQGDVGGGLGKIRATFADVTSIITSLWDRFGGTLTDYAKKTWTNMQQIIGGALKVVQGIFQTFSALLKGDWSGAWDGIKKILSGALDVIRGIVRQALNVMGTLFELGWSAVKGIAGAAWDGIKTAVSNGVDRVVGMLREKVDNFKSAGAALIGGFVDGMKNAGGVIEGIAGNVWNAVRSLLNSAIDKINAALEFTISLPGPDISINPSNIPHMAKGGIVNRPTLALIGEDGPEAVVPLSAKHNPGGSMPGMGGGGGNIIINISGALDPVAVGRQLEQILSAYTRNTGRPLQVMTQG